MTPEQNATLDQVRRAVKPAPRVSLTELSRSTKWRESMVEYAIVELCDHSETAGYLVSPAGMEDILARLEELERELEEAQLAAIVSQRGGNTIWESGEELAASVAGLFDAQVGQEAVHAS